MRVSHPDEASAIVSLDGSTIRHGGDDTVLSGG
jgi:hypothetical protein